MKNTFKYIISVIAVGFMTAMSMSADNNDDLFVANKTVKNNGNNKYTLTLETYATGVADIITTTTRQPIDAVLVLDLSSSMILNNYTNGKTRLAAMKESCIKFINEIKKDAEDNNVDHRISIVTYGSTDPYTKVVEGLLDVTNATNVDALTNSITKLTTTNSNPYEYTRHDNGLELAEGVLKTSNSKRSQVVVLLTDGVPQTQAFTTSVFGLKIGWSKK